VKIDEEGKKLHFIDQGIGMTSAEVEKYINQLFSVLKNFRKYKDSDKDSAKDSGIIGHFGLGFILPLWCFNSRDYY
jgi:molecular chaperone HtpG